MEPGRIHRIVEEGIQREASADLSWTGAFGDYLGIVAENPRVCRNAFQRLLDMVLSYGTVEYASHGDKITHCNFFDDPLNDGRDALLGLDRQAVPLLGHLRAAAAGLGAERRLLLLQGPPGSGKSAILRLLTRGLEEYSATAEGALYTFRWVIPDGPDRGEHPCPFREDPLKLIPEPLRAQVIEEASKEIEDCPRISVPGPLCPSCRARAQDLLRRHQGDWAKMVEHVQVVRCILSEQDRAGIGSIRPGVEAGAEPLAPAAEVSLAAGTPGPGLRLQGIQAEFQAANRGLLECARLGELAAPVLREVLDACAGHSIKPPDQGPTGLDLVVVGHGEIETCRQLREEGAIEGLQDRVVAVAIPYITTWRDEVQAHGRRFDRSRLQGRHLPESAIEAAALWAVLTRLREPAIAGRTILEKLWALNGTPVPGLDETTLAELARDREGDGLQGASPLLVQDRIAGALFCDDGRACLDPFRLLNAIGAGLRRDPPSGALEVRKRQEILLEMARQECQRLLLDGFQLAVAGDEDAVRRLAEGSMDEDCRERIEIIKSRLVESQGCCKECAGVLLTHLASDLAGGCPRVGN